MPSLRNLHVRVQVSRPRYFRLNDVVVLVSLS
jgi:hypothetical protein